MLQQTLLRRVASRSVNAFKGRAAFSTPAGEKSMSLNFNLPNETLYKDATVSQIIVPGSAGEYGVTAEHVPIIAQLKAGVLQIFHEGTSEPEKYFVPGGFSLTHANSVTDISCPEAVKIDDIDSAAVSSNYEAAKSAYASAEAGSISQAEAQVDMEVYKAMGAAVGLSLS